MYVYKYLYFYLFIFLLAFSSSTSESQAFHPLLQGSAHFFCKRPDRTCFRLCRPYGLSLSRSVLSLESSHRRHANEWVWLCSHKTVFVGTSLNFTQLSDVMKYLSSFDLFQLFKTVKIKNILNSQAVQKQGRQQARFVLWAIVCCPSQTEPRLPALSINTHAKKTAIQTLCRSLHYAGSCS